MEFCNVALTVESVDEILWGDHSNETCVSVLSRGDTCFSEFCKIKFGIFLSFDDKFFAFGHI